MKWQAYFRLMRFHKPVGIFLLWWPTAWALWISSNGLPGIKLVFCFFLGTVFMRAAGCVVNDMADRNFDRHVQRTSLRPLTTGEVSVLEASIVVLILLLASMFILLQLPSTCVYYAIAALVVTLIYPFCKRFLQAPQLVLGIAFSMSIPMVFVAADVSFNPNLIVLLLINFFWVVAYDTMYAMVDREDDFRLGIKSTAILFASYDRMVILSLQIFLHGLWIILALQNHFSFKFYILWLVGAGFLAEQQRLVNTRQTEACFKAFNTNVWYGFCMWVSLMVAY
jgi:4-hydroxybenzoate polyprenyltransferase